MYFGHKHVETELNCSHELATFLKYHIPSISVIQIYQNYNTSVLKLNWLCLLNLIIFLTVSITSILLFKNWYSFYWKLSCMLYIVVTTISWKKRKISFLSSVPQKLALSVSFCASKVDFPHECGKISSFFLIFRTLKNLPH